MLETRTEALYRASLQQNYRSTDRLFARLLLCEYLAALAVAFLVTPYTWVGRLSQPHIHVAEAIVLGGLLALLPIYFVARYPGQALTRYTVAIAQMGFSALFVHLSGGRIETHFHIFGSLAFLAFYRDWTVLVPATLVVAVDHILGGLYIPQSVFGVGQAQTWRWVEHVSWVVFEDVFLVWSCVQSCREMRKMAFQQAQLEYSQAVLERRVAERTASLQAAQDRMCDLSRRAGMAEVASGVLHNVGNALNSVRISASVVQGRVRDYRTEGLGKALGMLREHSAELPRFLSEDPRGRQLPVYLERAVGELVEVQTGLVDELGRLGTGLDHIHDIVRSQQSHAGVTGIRQCLPVSRMCEEAVSLCAGQLQGIDVTLELEPALVTVEKHRVLQVLVNLLGNAAQAMRDTPPGQRRLTVRSRADGNTIFISVSDSGHGVAPEHAERLFEHGFTTRPEGHGFGLHNSAIQANQEGGRLRFESPGPGRGATFTLELPIAA